MNYYDILGINKNASSEEIKDAYKKLIKKYHPDLYQGDKSFAEKKTKDINVAYDILSNPETKAAYDEEITPTPENITYDYTPPKYNNPSSYSYKDYYKNSTTNYSDFDDYQKRYTDYHRSKTPNSNYTYEKNAHDEFSDNIVKSIDKLSFSNKIKGLILILLLYLFIMLFALYRFTSFYKGETSGTILNQKKTIIENNTIITNTTTIPNKSNTFEEFDINKYYTNDELLKIYKENYSDIFDSFSEFKKAFSYYVYLYYNF